jgi:hypothetical protein
MSYQVILAEKAAKALRKLGSNTQLAAGVASIG